MSEPEHVQLLLEDASAQVAEPDFADRVWADARVISRRRRRLAVAVGATAVVALIAAGVVAGPQLKQSTQQVAPSPNPLPTVGRTGSTWPSSNAVRRSRWSPRRRRSSTPWARKTPTWRCCKPRRAWARVPPRRSPPTFTTPAASRRPSRCRPTAAWCPDSISRARWTAAAASANAAQRCCGRCWWNAPGAWCVTTPGHAAEQLRRTRTEYSTGGYLRNSGSGRASPPEVIAVAAVCGQIGRSHRLCFCYGTKTRMSCSV